MADSKLSALAAIASLADADELYVNSGGVEKKITGANLIARAVPKTLYDANSVLAATSDDTPAAVTMGASTILARLAAGNIKAATVAEMATLLAPALPGYELGYAEITTTATSTQTAQASATTAITLPSVTFDGSTAVYVEVFCEKLGHSVNTIGVSALIDLWEDSTDLGIIGRHQQTSGGSNTGSAFYAKRKLTPSAGAKVYTLRLWISATGTASITAGAGTGGASMPAFARIVRA